MGELVEWARTTAERELAKALPRRWKHVQGVAATAENISSAVPAEDVELLVASAWLHDIGYAPSIARSGFHALDGARWLLAQGQTARLASLVAHHSCATFEAEERGLSDALAAEFEQEQSITADALWYADMTTTPDGEPTQADARLAEISERYGPDDPVARFWMRARPTLLAAIMRVEKALQPM